jgi:hypothetical protein
MEEPLGPVHLGADLGHLRPCGMVDGPYAPRMAPTPSTTMTTRAGHRGHAVHIHGAEQERHQVDAPARC